MGNLIRLPEGAVVMTTRTTSHLHRAEERHKTEQRMESPIKSAVLEAFGPADAYADNELFANARNGTLKTSN